MSVNIQKLKVTISTNIPGQQSIEFTKDTLYYPGFNSFPNIDKYPYITTNILYPEKYLTDLNYEEIVNFFFNKNNFLKVLNKKEHKIKKNTSADYSNQNVTIMLKLLFSTKYFIVNNIHTSLDIITKKKSNNSIFFNPFKTKFSYIQVNGGIYTVTKVIWQNDIVNHPKYKELMNSVNDTIASYIEKPPDELLTQRSRTFGLGNPPKPEDPSYHLRTRSVPMFIEPFRVSGNVKIAKLFKDMQKNSAENFTTVEIDPVSGEHIITIPEWICDEKGWYEGTEVNIEVENDCIIIKDLEES